MRKKILFNQAKWFRLRILLISAGLVFIGNYLSAQAVGDYRSNVTALALWDAAPNWERWDGAAWQPATEYPGQSTGTGVVTISNGDLIILNVSPVNPIASLLIQEGPTSTVLDIFDGFTLNVTGQVLINAPTITAGVINQIQMSGGVAQLNCASLTISPGADPTKISRLQYTDGGIVSVTGNINMGNPLMSYIQFFGAGGILNLGGSVVGGEIIPGSGTIKFNGSGTQSIGVLPISLYNVEMANAASTFQLNGDVTLHGTLTLINGKINTGVNTLTLDNTIPANQVNVQSNNSYVYSTGAGRLRRNNLASGNYYLFPVGTSTNYLPVGVNTAAGTSEFAMNVFSPASTDGIEGGPEFVDKSKIVDAVWNIERPVGTGNSTITIQWVDALEGATFATYTDGQIGISHFVGSWLPAIASSASAGADSIVAIFNSFSPFGAGQIGESLALPVKFGSIKAYEKQNGIQLDWKVYSENKVKNYEVERSADARSFTAVGSLPALYNNTTDGDYGFFDANPLIGTSYYRIKNNDLDGRSSYSIIVRVNRNKTIKGFSLYPNPVANGIVLLQGSDLGRGNYKINIFGANGQEIYKQQIIHNGGTISQTIELPSTISKGVYMFSVKDEYGNIIFNEKLVKQ